MKQENLRKLFSPYVQIEAEKLQEGKGTGLGLWISRSIVNMHGGNVGAFSAGEGFGSTFYFELPCLEGLDETDATIDESLSLSGEIIHIPSDVPTPIHAPLNRETRLLQASLLQVHMRALRAKLMKALLCPLKVYVRKLHRKRKRFQLLKLMLGSRQKQMLIHASTIISHFFDQS